MESPIDLTPFGFTPTESSVYSDLLAGGPASGYSIGKRLGIARANAYQALDGLVAKQAAQVTGERPKRYRAVGPDAVFAQVIDRQSGLLDTLEAQIAQSPALNTEDIVTITGQRAIVDVALRTAARSDDPVQCLGPAEFLSLLAPAWRRRDSDGRETRIWIIGSGDVSSTNVRGHLPAERVERLFGGTVFILSAGGVTLTAQLLGDAESKGVWSREPTLVGSVKGTVAALTGAAEV